MTDEKFSLHQLMRKNLQEYQDPTYRKEVHLFLHNYYSNKIKDIDVKSITQEHEIALIEAYYHTKEVLEFDDLGGWIVEYTEPFDKAGYWKTIHPMFNDLVEVFKERLGSEHPYVGILTKKLAYLSEDRGRYNEAISYYQQVLEIYEKNLGKKYRGVDLVIDDLAIAMASNDLANSYTGIGEYEKALTLQQKALYILQNEIDKEHLYFTLVQQNIAMTYQFLGQYNKAMELCQEALTVREALLGEEGSRSC